MGDVYKYSQELNELKPLLTPPRMQFAMLFTTLENSLAREKKKDSSYNEDTSRRLYVKFFKRTHQIIELLQYFSQFQAIDTSVSENEVHKLFEKELNDHFNGKIKIG